VTCGGAGKSLYSFSAPDSYEGNVDNVGPVNSVVNETGAQTTTLLVADRERQRHRDRPRHPGTAVVTAAPVATRAPT
jgi:hypothetical protein